MRKFSSNNQCAVVEELACFQYSLNDKKSNYREKQSLILNILVSSNLKFYTSLLISYPIFDDRVFATLSARNKSSKLLSYTADIKMRAARF